MMQSVLTGALTRAFMVVCSKACLKNHWSGE